VKKLELIGLEQTPAFANIVFAHSGRLRSLTPPSMATSLKKAARLLAFFRSLTSVVGSSQLDFSGLRFG